MVRLLLLGAMFALAAPAQDPARARDEARRLAERGRYQTALPSAEPDVAGEAGEPWVAPEEKQGWPRDRAPSGLGSWSLSAGGTALAELLAWTIVGGLVVALLVIAIRAWRERGIAPPQAAPVLVVQRSRPAAESADELPDWARLAAGGSPTAALHAMLLHAFALLARMRGAPFPRAATGREILASVDPAHAGRLRPLLGLFERAQFGGIEVAPAEFTQSRDRFEQWLQQCGPSAA